MARPSGDLAAIVFVYSLLAISVGYHIHRSAGPSQYGLHREQTNQNDASKAECESKLRSLGLDVAAISDAGGNAGEIKKHYDLCQQIRAAQAAEDQAYWATPQFYVSLGSFVLLAGATWFAYGAYSQAKRQAIASEMQARIAEESYRNLERPYLLVLIDDDYVIRKGHMSATPWLNYRFHNIGKSPAILTAISVDFTHLVRMPDEVHHVPNVVVPTNPFIPAGRETEDTRCPFGRVDGEMYGSVKEGRSSLWFYGKVSYTDFFGSPYETEFCWMYNGMTGRMIRSGSKHNRQT